ncbi:response regulator transcription factor [Microbispora sp. SCL1-1]|nr:response regulator transcription factor [Microbispora sp. CL1-1]TQS16199.1 response regulator transcription factor [Microbispora sp. SCL1-1]
MTRGCSSRPSSPPVSPTPRRRGDLLRSVEDRARAAGLDVTSVGNCPRSPLVAFGLSNGEIAEHLVISPPTAKTHVARAIAKLDVRDRVQLVILAYESGLVRPGG